MGDEPRNENDIVRGRRQRLEKEIISWHTAKVSLSLSSFSLVQLYTKAIILHSTLTMTTRDVSERRLTLTLVNVKTKAHGADLAS